MTKLSIDFETSSPVNLKTEGVYRYAQHPDTEVLIMAYAFGDGPIQHWTPDRPFPQEVIDHIKAEGIICAWNSQFERLIFQYCLEPEWGVPRPPIDLFHCTAARARAHGMPSALGDCARAMGMAIGKDTEGSRLINQYSAKAATWDQIPADDQDRFIRYCLGDVELERTIATFLRELTPEEQYEYVVNEYVCDLGVPVDATFAQAAVKYADEVRDDVDRQISNLTGGKVRTARERKARDEWVLPKLTEAQFGILASHKKAETKVTYSFAETRRNELLADDSLDLDVRRYLELVKEGGGTSLRKYQGIVDREIGGRLYGTMLWNGAGATGRFSSKGLQLHNLHRATLEDPDSAIQDVINGVPLDKPAETLSRLVRASVYTPEGMTWFDWSSIEGRVLPWLEGSRLGEEKLDIYRDGTDPYLFNAAQTFGVAMDEVTPEQRQAGKLQELALQFMGGVGALRLMGINYGISLSETEAEHLRDAWRKANPWAPRYATILERAARNAVLEPDRTFTAGRVAYLCAAGWLWCILPSGRRIAYCMPRIEMVDTPWGEPREAVTAIWGAGRPGFNEPWPRRALNRNKLMENITQATAAALLREAIIRIDDSALDIIMHVHDEIVVEGVHLEELTRLMLELPDWAEGLPVTGEGHTGRRYGK